MLREMSWVFNQFSIHCSHAYDLSLLKITFLVRAWNLLQIIAETKVQLFGVTLSDKKFSSFREDLKTGNRPADLGPGIVIVNIFK